MELEASGRVRIIAREYVIQNSPTICASDAAAKRTYTRYVDVNDDNRVWLVSNSCNDPAAHIYCGYPYDTGSQGFAGRWLTFAVTAGHLAGGEVSLQGPWASNADALYANTGIDLRSHHLTFVVISLDRRFERGLDILTDVVYVDEKPTYGPFYRDRLIAHHIMNANPSIERLITYSKSYGGSSMGPYLRSRDYVRDNDS